MISWAIELAKKSQLFDKIIVSTDADEIAQIALQYGADVPFLRPAEISGDKVDTISVIKHAVDWHSTSWDGKDHLCCLYPTTPFLSADDLQQGLQSLLQTKATFSFAAAEFPHPVQRAMRVDDDGFYKLVNKTNAQTRSQDLEALFYDVGQFYWGSVNSWKNENVILGNDSCAARIPKFRAIDFDTEEDWQRAEWLLKAKQASGEGLQ